MTRNKSWACDFKIRKVKDSKKSLYPGETYGKKMKAVPGVIPE